MKQVIQNFKTGELRVTDVPQPALRAGGVLIRNHYSCISVGTEGASVKLAQRNLLGKAQERPDLVRKVINVAKRDGVLTAYRAAMRSLDTPLPLGYSCAGTVIGVGDEVTDIKVGDRVACGGSGYANHAEVVYVPRNLCTKLADEVDFRAAAFVTVGSVAMQSVRTAHVEVGETVAVIGLGLIGLLTVQVLKSAGCRVIGIDIDPHKVEVAKQIGAHDAVARQERSLIGRVNQLTEGIGVDAVIITAATESNDPVTLAGEIACHRGRVVVVGRIGTNIPRDTYRYKELLLRSSVSYGPGRYDPSYEENGIDYPISYVRWTENRNMQAFAELLRSGSVTVKPIITHEFSINEAVQAYDTITGKISSDKTLIGVLLKYDTKREVGGPRIFLRGETAYAPLPGKVRIGVIGAGSFARNVLLPILSKIPRVQLCAIASASGISARTLGERYGFEYCAENAEEIIRDSDISAVMILTRHDTHGPLVGAALEEGKAVYVEKPLAVNPDHLEHVIAAWEATQCGGRVMVGFNRRFAPLAVKLKRSFDGRSQPMVITYRVNAGFQPRDHWIHDPLQGGGRIVGEGGHFIDFMLFLTGARPVWVWSQSVGGPSREDILNEDNAVVCVAFEDGSIGTLTYVSTGDRSFSKERVEVFCDQAVGVLEDFRSLRLVQDGRTRKIGGWIRQNKGYKAEVQQFITAVAEGKPFPVHFEDYVLTTRVTFGALASQSSGNPVQIVFGDWGHLGER
jgi:predicted dehydrogenase/threonine dehydrogenase-like Zn-dependent dehydrogenase